MAIPAKHSSVLLRAAFLFAAIATLCLTPTADAQTQPIPVEGLPSSLEPQLNALSEAPFAPDSLFAARRQAERKAQTVARLLESEGYFAATVEPWAEGAAPFPRGVRVNPGPLFLINQTAIEYEGPPPEDETAEKVTTWLELLPEGAPARAQPVLDISDAILESLQNAGYPDAELAPVDAVADGRNHTLDVTYKITAGPRITYGYLEFEGLERTNPDFLHDMRPWRAGEPVSNADLEEYRSRLASTGIFNRTSVELGPQQEEPTRDVIVTVTESPRRTIALGASASTSEGFGLDAEWQTRNISGRGDSITVSGTAATLERRLQLSYARPHFGRYGRDLTLSAAAEDFETDAFDQTGASIAGKIEDQFTPRVRGEFGVEFAYASIDDARTRAAGTGRRELFLLAAPIAAEYTGVRNVLDPVNGVRARLFVEPGLTYGDDTIGFTRLIGEASAYRELGSNKLIGAVRGRVGSIIGPAGLPPDRLFYAGGGGSVRGYEYQSLSPRDANDNIIGGRSIVETSLELRYKSSGRMGYVAFLDAGAAADQGEPSFDNLRAGAGLGLRYDAGFAPLRADIAVPLNKRQGDADFQIYISIGQAF